MPPRRRFFPCVLAARLHAHILASKSKLPLTLQTLNQELDLKPYDNPAVLKPTFVLATSAIHFETQADCLLPASIMIVPKGGSMFPLKEFVKEHFKTIKYTDLVLNGVTKAAWVLPVAAHETEDTGTLAKFLWARSASTSRRPSSTQMKTRAGDAPQCWEGRGNLCHINTHAQQAQRQAQHG